MPVSLQASTPEARRASRFLLWVDGVGGFLVCTGGRVTIGGPGGTDAADFSIQAPLSRRHAALIAEDDHWWFEPHGAAEVAGRSAEGSGERWLLPGHAELRLGDTVRMGFAVPNPLSLSAVLTPLSGHRSLLGVDGCVLMQQNMVLAPGEAAHVRCPDWPGKLVLHQLRGELYWQPFGLGTGGAVGGRTRRIGEPIRPGDVVQGDGFRFHIEPLG